VHGRNAVKEEPVHGRPDHRDLEAAESRVKTADVCRKHGIGAATFYGWKSNYGGMEMSEAQRRKATEDENRRLKLPDAGPTLHLICRVRVGGIRVAATIVSNQTHVDRLAVRRQSVHSQ